MIIDKKKRFAKSDGKDVERHYLNNKTLLPLLQDYKTTGKISDELGLCFILLAKKMSNSSNFRGYTYVDEFIQDGVECCLRYCHNFNIEKSSNPFGYFSEIMKFAFINRIKKEGKYQKLKKKIQQYDENGYLFDADIICNSLDNSDDEVITDKIVDEGGETPPVINAVEQHPFYEG